MYLFTCCVPHLFAATWFRSEIYYSVSPVAIFFLVSSVAIACSLLVSVAFFMGRRISCRTLLLVAYGLPRNCTVCILYIFLTRYLDFFIYVEIFECIIGVVNHKFLLFHILMIVTIICSLNSCFGY